MRLPGDWAGHYLRLKAWVMPALGLLGWWSLTLGLVLATGWWWLWWVSVGVLLLGLFGFQLLGYVLWRGLYQLTQRPSDTKDTP